MSLLLTTTPAAQNLPINIRQGRAQPKRIFRVKAKPRVRSNPQIFTPPPAPFANFPEQIRHQAQKRRVPVVKAKKPLRSNLVPSRLGRGGSPQFPIVIKHGQLKRVSHVKAKKPLRSNLTVVRIPQSPPPILPLAVRHPRGQTKRIPRVHPKRIVRSSIELRIPQAPTATLPLSVRHPRGQTKRIPRVKAKRITRSSIQLRIPQAPTPRLAPAIRPQRGQRRRGPQVRPKKALRSNLGLILIPQAPAVVVQALPLPIYARRHRGLFALRPIRIRRVHASLLSILAGGSGGVALDAIVNWRSRGGY